MLRYPMDVPCSVCDAAAGEPCRYVMSKALLRSQMPGYHATRKYTDFPAARAAEIALTS